MSIVTITSDWGINSPYGAIIKAKVSADCSGVAFVDVTYNIEPFNMMEASFMIKRVKQHFSDGTIHLICINTQDIERVGLNVVLSGNQYFIAPNNGLLSMILGNDYEKGCTIKSSCLSTFHELDTMVPIVCKLINGSSLDDIGLTDDFSMVSRSTDIVPAAFQNRIIGRVIHIDNYENVVTNITRSLFESTIAGRRFRILFNTYKAEKLSQSYTDVEMFNYLVMFNSFDLLEIAVSYGNAASTLGLSIDSPVFIEFID